MYMISRIIKLRIFQNNMSAITELHNMDKTRQSVRVTVTLLFTALILVLLSTPLFAADDSEDTVQFNLGQKQYAAGDFDAAINSFSRAVSLVPGNSVYHHWLGKSYGRLAEESGLLTAYALSRKTRRELERAVELDNQNVDALTDLMEYYRRAPGFLGGGEEKADKIRIRLDELNTTEESGEGPEPEKS